jgi:hypothetical protein
MPSRPSVLIARASTGIGAVYADRFVRRASDGAQLEAPADRPQGDNSSADDAKLILNVRTRGERGASKSEIPRALPG